MAERRAMIATDLTAGLLEKSTFPDKSVKHIHIPIAVAAEGEPGVAYQTLLNIRYDGPVLGKFVAGAFHVAGKLLPSVKAYADDLATAHYTVTNGGKAWYGDSSIMEGRPTSTPLEVRETVLGLLGGKTKAEARILDPHPTAFYSQAKETRLLQKMPTQKEAAALVKKLEAEFGVTENYQTGRESLEVLFTGLTDAQILASTIPLNHFGSLPQHIWKAQFEAKNAQLLYGTDTWPFANGH